jgi:hypothetical protein
MQVEEEECIGVGDVEEEVGVKSGCGGGGGGEASPPSAEYIEEEGRGGVELVEAEKEAEHSKEDRAEDSSGLVTQVV